MVIDAFARSQEYVRPQPNDVSVFARMLRRERERGKLSQMELARRAGINNAFVCRMEADERMPKSSTARALADVLELTGASRVQFLLAADCSPCDEIPDEQTAAAIYEALRPRVEAV